MSDVGYILKIMNTHLDQKRITNSLNGRDLFEFEGKLPVNSLMTGNT
jgi:hypothetical protein